MTTVVVKQPVTQTVTVRRNTPVVEVEYHERETIQLQPARPAVVEMGIPGPRGPQGEPGPAGAALLERVAGQALGGHRVVRPIGAGLVAYADTTNVSHGDDTLGLTTGAASVGAPALVQNGGSLTMGGWSWDEGEPVFLGANGQLTQTPIEPTDGAAFTQIVGFAERPDTLYIQLHRPIYF